MQALLETLHLIAGLVVLAEALNKLERTAPFAPGMTGHARLVDGLKALAWVLLAIGAAGALAAPVLFSFGIQSQQLLHKTPSLAETAVLVGFAVLIVRTRLKEG